MGVKENVIKLLLANQNNYISGNAIAKKLGVSRNSVWKAINSLEKDGYKIEAVTNKGYCLLANNDILSKEGIEKYLKNNFTIEVHKTVTSTNTLLKEKYEEGSVIVASHQSQGKGRQGRDFHSPSDTGVYFSILLRPHLSNDQAIFITSMAAVAVCDAITEICGVNSRIKWVNDIFVHGKKVCGILSEATLSMENATIDHIVLGIGINIYQPNEGFPEDIQEIAGFILNKPIDDVRNKLVAKVLDNFWIHYSTMDIKSIAQSYKDRSYVLGKEVYIDAQKVKVLDIDENCALVIQNSEGNIQTLSSGEIRIKL